MESLTIKKQRTVWIDNLRGILLFLIVIGHLGEIPSGVQWLLRPTDLLYVSAFFFLSGLLFNNDKYAFSAFVQRKVKSLLVPYFAISLLVTVLDWNLFRFPLKTIHDTAWAIVMGDGALKATPLWFVSTLFVANILFKCGHLIKHRICFHIFFFIMPFACYTLYAYNIRLPFRIDSAFGACFLMYTAQCYHSLMSSKGYFRNVLLFVAAAFALAGVVGGIGLLNYNTVHTLMSFPAAVGGCFIFAFIFSRYIKTKLPPPIGCQPMDYRYSVCTA